MTSGEGIFARLRWNEASPYHGGRYAMKRVLFSVVPALLCVVAIGTSPGGAARAAASTPPSCPWLTESAAPAVLASQVVAQMTTAEKVSMLGLQTVGSVQNETPAIPRLCVPALVLNDGPIGDATTSAPVTIFPAPLAVAASFDSDVAQQVGQALAGEATAEGIGFVQAPEANVQVLADWGRGFENFGNSPVLDSEMVGAMFHGILAGGVQPEVKHFGPYVQETNRVAVNLDVSNRALYEVYLAPFRAATAAGVTALMCAYGRLDGVTTCANPLTYKAAGVLGFQGIIRSDYSALATNQVVPALKAGIDLIKPFDPTPIDAALKDHHLNISVVNRAVETTLTVMFATGLFTNPTHPTGTAPYDPPVAVTTALTAAERSMVLLKDSGSLPISPSSTVALIGDAGDAANLQGQGSAHVANSANVVTDVAGLTQQWPSIGVDPATPSLTDLDLSPIASSIAHEKSATVVVPTSMDGLVDFSVPSSGGVGLFLDGRPLLRTYNTGVPGYTPPNEVAAEITPSSRITLYWGSGFSEPTVKAANVDGVISAAAAAAATAQVAIVDVGVVDSEGIDNESLELPGFQDQLIDAVAAANPDTVVVIHSGDPVLMPWLSKVSAVVEAWYPGEQAGTALAQLLSGSVDFSGRLPVVFPSSDAGAPLVSFSDWPDASSTENLKALGGIDVGQVWYSTHHKTPLFNFGFGLGYTTFSMSDLTTDVQPDGSVVATVAVTNTGETAGWAVPELYVTSPASTGEPAGRFAGATPVDVGPGDTTTVTITVPDTALQIWRGSGFTLPTGTYGLDASWAAGPAILSGSFAEPAG